MKSAAIGRRGTILAVVKRFQRTAVVGKGQPAQENRVPAAPALPEVELEMGTLFDRAPIGLAQLSRDGELLAANESLGSMLGLPPADLTGKPMKGLVHPDDSESVQAVVTRLGDGAVATYRGENRLLDANGESVWVELQIVAVAGPAGVENLLAYVTSVGDRRRFEEQLRHVATHDAVTGLRNRRGFEEELDRHEDRMHRRGSVGAVLVIDLDNFRQVNEEHGYVAGDSLLMSVAEVLRSVLTATDVPARLGGDEFAALLPDATGEEAEATAGRLLERLRAEPLSLGRGQHAPVRASTGIALFSDDTGSADTVLAFADDAVHEAKESGGDRFAVYDPAAPRVTTGRSRLGLREKIRRALDEDKFRLYAQPVLDLRTDTVTRYELLIRMLDGDQVVSPLDFLHVAERHGLVKEIDAYVANRAIDLLASDEFPADAQVEVNLSGASLAGGDLVELLERRFEEVGESPDRLVFEVSEPTAAANLAVVREFAEKLAALGCQFALDDFGTGFGNFAYLKHLPFDYVKIDGEFVEGLMTSATDRLIIESTVAIASGLGKETVAEFVGDSPTLHFLQRLGVDYAQGYYVGRPLPLEEMLQRIADGAVGSRPEPVA